MKTTVILLAGFAALLTGTVMAEENRTETSETLNPGSAVGVCQTKAIQHLKDATDITKSAQQDWNLNASEAYRELEEMGYQGC